MSPERITEKPIDELEEQLKIIRAELDALYLKFYEIVHDRSDPLHYQKLNAQSREIALKHGEYCRVRSQIIGRSAISRPYKD